MKALFFDIDGTLLDFDGQMAPSTKEALDRARGAGHKLLLCTGRSYGQIYRKLLTFGFDGIVCAAGADVICDGQQILHHTMPVEKVNKFCDLFEGRGYCYGVQTQKQVFVTEEGYDLMRQRFVSAKVAPEMIDSIMDRVRTLPSLRDRRDVEKMFFNDIPETVDDVIDALSDPYYFVQPSSFSTVSVHSGEITERGISKSTGMAAALSFYGLTGGDSVAFGDGPNDADMLEAAGIGVCMGNGMDELKKNADLVTDDFHHDGIYHAMERLSLF